jgi:hypothetical protein
LLCERICSSYAAGRHIHARGSVYLSVCVSLCRSSANNYSAAVVRLLSVDTADLHAAVKLCLSPLLLQRPMHVACLLMLIMCYCLPLIASQHPRGQPCVCTVYGVVSVCCGNVPSHPLCQTDIGAAIGERALRLPHFYTQTATATGAHCHTRAHIHANISTTHCHTKQPIHSCKATREKGWQSTPAPGEEPPAELACRTLEGVVMRLSGYG